MSTVQLPGEKLYDTQMIMHTITFTSNVILTSEFQKHLSTVACKHGVIDQGQFKNEQVKKSGQKKNSVFRMMLMSRTNM